MKKILSPKEFDAKLSNTECVINCFSILIFITSMLVDIALHI
jgi:hypothetical protein